MNNNELSLPNGKLDLYKVLDQLVLDGVVSKENSQVLRSMDRNNKHCKKHPFTVITERGWKNMRHPQKAYHSG